MDVCVKALVKLQMQACQSVLGAHANAQVLSIGVSAKIGKVVPYILDFLDTRDPPVTRPFFLGRRRMPQWRMPREPHVPP